MVELANVGTAKGSRCLFLKTAAKSTFYRHVA